MSIDFFSTYAIQLDYGEELRGSGVIFKPSKFSKTIYIITAKHIFFGADNTFKSHTDISLKTINTVIRIFLEATFRESIEINLKNNAIYFLDNPEIDLAFGILDIDNSSCININLINPLEILDCENTSLEKINFFLLGYPSAGQANSNIPKMSSFRLKYLNEDKYCLSSNFVSDNPISSASKILYGLSGSGVFVKQKEGVSCLSHMQFFSSSNNFYCTRLDLFLDEMNLRIKQFFPEEELIKLQSYIILENENWTLQSTEI